MADLATEMFGEAPEVPAEPPVAPEAEQEAPQAQPAPQPEPQPEAPVDRREGFVPLNVVLEERERRQAAERRAQELEQRYAKPAQDVPDPFDDGPGFAEYTQKLIDERTAQATFTISDRFARQAHGEEAVNAAVQWAQEKAHADPLFAASYMRDPDPIGYIVRQHQRDGLLSQIGDASSVDDWFAREAAKRNYQPASAIPAAAAPVAVQAQPAPVPAPPRSIAGLPSTGGGVPGVKVGATAGIEGLFPKG